MVRVQIPYIEMLIFFAILRWSFSKRRIGSNFVRRCQGPVGRDKGGANSFLIWVGRGLYYVFVRGFTRRTHVPRVGGLRVSYGSRDDRALRVVSATH